MFGSFLSLPFIPSPYRRPFQLSRPAPQVVYRALRNPMAFEPLFHNADLRGKVVLKNVFIWYNGIVESSLDEVELGQWRI